MNRHYSEYCLSLRHRITEQEILHKTIATVITLFQGQLCPQGLTPNIIKYHYQEGKLG